MGQSVARNGHPIHWVTIHKKCIEVVFVSLEIGAKTER